MYAHVAPHDLFSYAHIIVCWYDTLRASAPSDLNQNAKWEATCCHKDSYILTRATWSRKIEYTHNQDDVSLTLTVSSILARSMKNWWCHRHQQKGELQGDDIFHFRVLAIIRRTLQADACRKNYFLDIPQKNSVSSHVLLQWKTEKHTVVMKVHESWRNDGQVHVVNLIHDKGPIYAELHCTVMVREFFRCITVIVRADFLARRRISPLSNIMSIEELNIIVKFRPVFFNMSSPSPSSLKPIRVSNCLQIIRLLIRWMRMRINSWSRLLKTNISDATPPRGPTAVILLCWNLDNSLWLN